MEVKEEQAEEERREEVEDDEKHRAVVELLSCLRLCSLHATSSSHIVLRIALVNVGCNLAACQMLSLCSEVG